MEADKQVQPGDRDLLLLGKRVLHVLPDFDQVL
jgi:hypothetical protein